MSADANETATRAELAATGGASVSPALYAAALSLAAALDSTTSARDIAAVSKELRAALAEFRALATKQPGETSTSDDLARQRAARIARLSTGAGS